MHALSTTVMLLGVGLIVLGVGVVVYPPLLVVVVSALSIIAGVHVLWFGMRLRRMSTSFQNFGKGFFIKRH